MTSDIHHNEQGKTLSRSDTEKRRLEHQAARVFLRCYEAEFGVPMRHIWHNEPAKPDTSCYCQNERLDLEIAHLYANESEAQLACGHTIENPLWRYLSDLSGLDLQQRLNTALTHLLRKKATRHYHSQRVWLVIRNASPLWHRGDILEVVEQLQQQGLAHQMTHFEQVWIVPDFEGQEALVRVK